MIELLSPAGNFEKMKAAIRFGANAVYLAGKGFGMRAAAGNFSEEELKAAVFYARERGVKVYITVNVQPREEEYARLGEYLRYLGTVGPDALIVADLGVMALVKELLPNMPIHISTQANVVSSAAACAYAALGAERIVLSRELSLQEIRAIREKLPKEVELEAFVHGAMCVSYSGRCLLSNYLIGRDACRGACAQPCRWHYTVKEITATVVEEKRPNEIITVHEEGGESFFMSSCDLCMIEHIGELIEAGVTSFKIEGRMKSAYYTAAVTNAYRMAIDDALQDRPYDPALMRELECLSHRPYDTGYFFDSPHERAKITEVDGPIGEKAYLGKVLSYNEKEGMALILQNNKLSSFQRVELLTPGRVGVPFDIGQLYDEELNPIENAPHPQMRFFAKMPFPVAEGDLLRAGEEL